MNTKRLNAWALVNKQTNQIEALEFTRANIREQKRSFAKKGIDTKIAQMKFNKFAR